MDDNGYKALIARVIIQAIMDLKRVKSRRYYSAKKFLLSNDCETMCFAIKFNHNAIKNINWDNPEESINFNMHMKSLPFIFKS